jgi:hypothetical protein
MRVARSIAVVVAALVGAAAPIAPALAAGLTPNARYAGRTSQGTPATLRLSRDARRVALVRIYYRVSCDDGAPPRETYTDLRRAPLGRHHFEAAGVYKGSVDGSTNAYRIRGSVSASAVRGTFSLTATTTRHGLTVHCASGPLSWSLRRVR